MWDLDYLYEKLDLYNGTLLTATDNPLNCPDVTDWLEKGEWLAAAKRAGGEKIFFVGNNPVAVFTKCSSEPEDKIYAFNNVWCLARPRLLFMASPSEISVYDLAQRPIDPDKPEDWNSLKALDSWNDWIEASESFEKYHRENIESGKIFGDHRFGMMKDRADKALIRDLKTVRRELADTGLYGEKLSFAHALIGRSIFIRYLEDRGIITGRYFWDIASQNGAWIDILEKPVNRIGLDISNKQTYYTRVLEDKDFTYALFRALARDFNGDMFPDVETEEQVVQPGHLRIIQDLLFGDAGKQKRLFFYSYRFDIIPLELISSIYEEFYHSLAETKENRSKARQDGAYYTPPVLVELLLSRVLTHEIIAQKPRVLDPACGSGIFLVEAFRRMVRYQSYEKKQPLTFTEIKNIIKNQIAGIEVNEDAARITSFSLYLSMLHYLEPSAIDYQIKLGNRLPNLLASENTSDNHYHCILAASSFNQELIDSNEIWKRNFGEKCADIVIGNPPWGALGKKADRGAKLREREMLEWCSSQNKVIGDKEPSQAFLWRSLFFLKDHGTAALLVSSGALFKHSGTSSRFRQQWLQCVALQEVYNFTHVRTFFFKGSDSPFLAMIFSPKNEDRKPVLYWSAKQTLAIRNNQYIMLSKNDLSIIREDDLSDYRTWKIYDHGSYKDVQFIRQLTHFPKAKPLSQYVAFSHVGLKKGNQSKEADWLAEFKKLDNESFSRYGSTESLVFENVPEKVEHRGKRKCYIGRRILLKEGPQQSQNSHGRIIARLEDESYAFNHSIHAIKLKDDHEWLYKLITGILWSSFARYYLFLTSSNWGLWHDKVLINERLQLPIVVDRENPANEKVLSVVDRLRNYHPPQQDGMHLQGLSQAEIEAQQLKWERELDEAIYELYGFTDEQIDLIKDCCEVTLPYYYKPFKSTAATPAINNNDYSGISAYINIFCRRWNAYLNNDEEMRVQLHFSTHNNILALEFFPADRDDPWDINPKNGAWGYILEQTGQELPQPMSASKILLDGLVHVVSSNGIIIIKRNEKRFWTRSLAREDADITICKAMLPSREFEGRAK